MQFDDRLATVLKFRADGAVTSRIQYRQLLDLLGTQQHHAQGEQIDQALARFAELRHQIPADERARMLEQGNQRLRSPRLVALLAATEPAVAQAAIGRAELSETEWLDLLPALSPVARAAMRQRSDLTPILSRRLSDIGIYDRGLPPSDAIAAAQDPVAELPATSEILAPPAPDLAPEGIGAIVKRIEAYRKARPTIDAPPSGEAPRLPLGEEQHFTAPRMVRAFDFAADAAGRIVWADPGVFAMVVGSSLQSIEPKLSARMRGHQRIAAARAAMTGAPAIAGDWQIDAVPRFDPQTGGFSGYQGRFRRPGPVSATSGVLAVDSEADRIRQLLHELRTPVNAIQGFAEVIQQQLFGPTPHEYRALAATIAGDAARMLAAFEELERLARLESGALELDPGATDFAALLTATAHQLETHTRQRQVGFEFHGETSQRSVAISQPDAERLAWRLLATLGGAAAPGELLQIAIAFPTDLPGAAQFDLALPASLASKDANELFHAAVGSVPQAIASGVFGVGFALRLARAEAKASGGSLMLVGNRLRLTLPGLTAPVPHHSEEAQRTGA